MRMHIFDTIFYYIRKSDIMEFTKKGILKNAEEENVKYIRLMFTDIHGVIKNVEIPARILNVALNNQIMFDGSSIDEIGRASCRERVCLYV